jgi:hypothetical protein
VPEEWLCQVVVPAQLATMMPLMQSAPTASQCLTVGAFGLHTRGPTDLIATNSLDSGSRDSNAWLLCWVHGRGCSVDG